MGNIFDADACRVGMGDIEKLSAVGSDLRGHDIKGFFLLYIFEFCYIIPISVTYRNNKVLCYIYGILPPHLPP